MVDKPLNTWSVRGVNKRPKKWAAGKLLPLGLQFPVIVLIDPPGIEIDSVASLKLSPNLVTDLPVALPPAYFSVDFKWIHLQTIPQITIDRYR